MASFGVRRAGRDSISPSKFAGARIFLLFLSLIIFAYAKDVGGTIKMDVYVTDANAMGASAVMKSEVTSDLSTMTLRKGVAMSVHQIKTNFGANVFTASGLPPGLVIDRATGKLSGKPTQNGLFTVTFFASKNGKDAVMAMKSIRVR